MKLTGVLSLGFALTVAATPATPVLKPRAGTSVSDLLATISKGVDSLDSAVKAWNGGSIDPVQSANDKLVSDIKDATSTVKSGSELSTSDALGLVTPVQDLTKAIDTVVDDLNDRKSKIVAAGAGGQTLSDLKEQYSAASDLADAISDKVPSELKSTATQLSSQITDAIQKGIDDFKDVGGSSSSSAAPTSSAATTAATTTPATPATTSAASSTPAAPVPGGASPSGSTAPSGVASPTGGPKPSSTGPVTPPIPGAASFNGVSGAAGLAAGVLAVLAF